MAKIDQVKEEIAFLTKLLMVFMGILIIVVSGVVSLHLTGETPAIYWFGVLAIAILVVLCLYLFSVIRRHICHLGAL